MLVSYPVRLCGCQNLPGGMSWIFTLFFLGLQLLVTAVISVLPRPKTRSSALTRKYFVASILNNLFIHYAHLRMACTHSSEIEGRIGVTFLFIVGGQGATAGGSVITIVIVQTLVLRRL